jgi:hypothetical protein
MTTENSGLTLTDDIRLEYGSSVADAIYSNQPEGIGKQYAVDYGQFWLVNGWDESGPDHVALNSVGLMDHSFRRFYKPAKWREDRLMSYTTEPYNVSLSAKSLKVLTELASLWTIDISYLSPWNPDGTTCIEFSPRKDISPEWERTTLAHPPRSREEDPARDWQSRGRG